METATEFGRSSSAKVPLSHAYEAFHLRCRAQNLTAGTCGWYKSRLGLFGQFLESKGVALACEVTPHLIRMYLEKMREAGNCSGLIARDYGAFKCFFRFLARERLIPQNPITLVEKPRMEDKVIRPLSLDQARLVLSKINQKRFDGQRLWTVAVVILDTGLRSAEVVGLRKDEIDFQKGVLRVMGKGNKEREVPFSTTAKQALWNYLVRRGDIPGQDLVFTSHFGRRLDRSWIIRSFRCLSKRAGIQGVRLSAHTLRHTFATQYILNGGDVFSLQRILGHSTLEMVQRYVGLANRDMSLLHQRFSPLERMGIVPGAKRRVLVR
ncbi:MAG: tyrosine-type recombinase/integrase [Elusimicrobia bacterium]|nr:tyrosine-type recombinase/integrase [Elusimicrobiota bacterium]MDE2425039.1 tyrosine-type recombinase/integrase [Elusimicrobiota bacterium]